MRALLAAVLFLQLLAAITTVGALKTSSPTGKKTSSPTGKKTASPTAKKSTKAPTKAPTYPLRASYIKVEYVSLPCRGPELTSLAQLD